MLNRFGVWDEAQRPDPHPLYVEMRREAPVYEGIGTPSLASASPVRYVRRMDPHDVAAIEATASDYIEGWYRGDESRMDRALHDDLVKRTAVAGETGDDVSFRLVSKHRMMEMTAEGGGEDPGSTFKVAVDDISGDMASARTVSKEYVDYLQLVRTPTGWKIANVLFRMH